MRPNIRLPKKDLIKTKNLLVSQRESPKKEMKECAVYIGSKTHHTTSLQHDLKKERNRILHTNKKTKEATL
jgi:hypothetical protein